MSGEFNITYFTPSNLLHDLPNDKLIFFIKIFNVKKYKLTQPNHNLIDANYF